MDFHRISTAVLRDFSFSEEEVEAAVENLGQFGGNSDGIVGGDDGRIYITDLTNSRIVVYEPNKRRFSELVRDPRLLWPDTLDLGPDGWLYFSVNRLHRAFGGTINYDSGEDNFEIWRMRETLRSR